MGSSLASKNDANAERGRAFDWWFSQFPWLYDFLLNVNPLWGPRLKKAIPHIQGPRVLEVSFGTGYLMEKYAGKFETTGLDYNPRYVEAARRKLESRGIAATLVEGDAHAMPFEDASFDCLVNSDAFTLYADPQKAMGEFYRVLKPGGRLILLEWDYPNPPNRLGTWWVDKSRRNGMPYVAFDPLLKSAGFEKYDDIPVGMAGTLHMFLCEKPG